MALNSAKLPVERDASSLGHIVTPAQGLPIRYRRLAASAVWMHVVGFQPLCLIAAPKEPSVVFATPTSARQDGRPVLVREAADRVTPSAWVSDGVDHANRGGGQENHQPSRRPW